MYEHLFSRMNVKSYALRLMRYVRILYNKLFFCFVADMYVKFGRSRINVWYWESEWEKYAQIARR